MTDIFWWHSIDLGDRVTPGHKSPELLDFEWRRLQLDDLDGRSVLDIGCWDGYFSFRAEREGAARVVALDHYVWSLDLPKQQAYWRECQARGVTPEPYHDQPALWHPDTLPGRAGFDVAHRARKSRVEPVVADIMDVDARTLGQFDVVLYLGVIYHVEEPLTALRRVFELTAPGGQALVESEALMVEGHERALWEFVPGAEVNADIGNWWIPTAEGLRGVCKAAGFGDVEIIGGPPPGLPVVDGVGRYRCVVRARR